MILDRLLNRQALAIRKPEPPERLMIVVGATYPSMFGHGPALLTVTRIYEFDGLTYVDYMVEHLNHNSSDPLSRFCQEIARRLAYENNTVQSVDVTEYFRQRGLTGGKGAGLI